ncbi:MAG: hypothetical protein KC420_21275 [Myxococcales bacterium]|nr:hypothetical protein [Myxococcales bacterium]MCB9566053.1 hypothetical protein [Myxococcales bacterium]MCB9703908.1 hypothetical protein [Myxococcales bacterium]
MPSWKEIKDYARSKYKLAEDEERYFSLIFGFNDGRSQKIFVRRYEAFDMEWVEFRSVVCNGDKMPPKVALRKNEDFACGALALDGDGDYVLIYNAPLPTMDPDEFELPLHVIAKTADRLESEYSGEDDF